MARRRLGMTAKEWLSTPWWEQNILIEGMQDEGLIKSRSEMDAPTQGVVTDERIHRDGAATITERDYSYDIGDMADLPESGFTVGTLG